MPVELEDAKRMAIAMQLSEMKTLQHLLVSNDHLLIHAVRDDNIRERLQHMLEQDRKNLSILDTVIIQYGVQQEPKETVGQNFETIQHIMDDAELTLSEKVFQHELLKHRQVMTGLIVHKAAQLVGADVEAAIAPLQTINFENRIHQEQLEGILEILDVCELTGQKPDQGVWARVEDAIAAVSGVVGSVVTRTDDEISIRDLLLMDHSKTDILFTEILGSDDSHRIEEYFRQLYRDVKVHGLAEEQVLYPAVRPYYNQMQEIVEQTDHVIELLDEMQSLDAANPGFKDQVNQLRRVVRDHINQEENDIFPKLKHNFSPEQQKQLATEFKTAKSQLQEQLQEQKNLIISPPQGNHQIHDDRRKSQAGFMSNTIPWKLVFQTKAVINWVEAVILLLGDRWIREFLRTEPLVNVEYSQLVYGLVFIIGVGYWWVSQDFSKNHGIIKLGILAQYSVFAVLAYHTLLGTLHPFYLVSGVIDLVFAVLFSLFIYSESRSPNAVEF
jgi:hemerythrin superfamily protein